MIGRRRAMAVLLAVALVALSVGAVGPAALASTDAGVDCDRQVNADPDPSAGPDFGPGVGWPDVVDAYCDFQGSDVS